MLCGSLERKGVSERMDTCISMAESLCCAPEAMTTLLTGYTPIENKQLKNKFKKLIMYKHYFIHVLRFVA